MKFEGRKMSKKQAMRKNKRRGYSTYGAARVEQLLSQEPPKISIMTGVVSSSGSSGERSAAARQRESEFRHRIMSDEKIGYVYRRDAQKKFRMENWHSAGNFCRKWKSVRNAV